LDFDQLTNVGEPVFEQWHGGLINGQGGYRLFLGKQVGLSFNLPVGVFPEPGFKKAEFESVQTCGCRTHNHLYPSKARLPALFVIG